MPSAASGMTVISPAVAIVCKNEEATEIINGMQHILHSCSEDREEAAQEGEVWH